MPVEARYDPLEDETVVPEILLPAQFFTPRRRHAEAAQRLMRRILEDAMECYQKHLFARTGRGQQLFRDAEQWLMAEGVSGLCSFESICDVLDLDPDYLRSALRRWRAARERERFAFAQPPRRHHVAHVGPGDRRTPALAAYG